jgi:hypothetical protein
MVDSHFRITSYSLNAKSRRPGSHSSSAEVKGRTLLSKETRFQALKISQRRDWRLKNSGPARLIFKVHWRSLAEDEPLRSGLRLARSTLHLPI